MSNVVPISLNQQEAAKVMEKIVVEGDLARLSPEERLFYYQIVCESVGLNPLTRPFEYIYLNGRLVLYAKKDATDQLRKIHGISVSITSREKVGDVYVVTAKARDKEGREDEAIGAVPLQKREMVLDQKKQKYVPTGKMIPLTAEELANAIMRAETKSKRRVTLSIAGLGMLDETELETIQDVQPFHEESSPSVVEMKLAEEKQEGQEKPAAPENPAQQEQPAEKTANPVSGDDSGKSDVQEFTLLNVVASVSKKTGEPFMEIFVKGLKRPIYARGEGMKEAEKIKGGEGSKIILETFQETFQEGNFIFLKRVIDGGSSPAQPEPATDGTGKDDETATGIAQKETDLSSGDDQLEKRYILKAVEVPKETGNGDKYMRFRVFDNKTGEIFQVVAVGEEKIHMVKQIPSGKPFYMELRYNDMNQPLLVKVVV